MTTEKQNNAKTTETKPELKKCKLPKIATASKKVPEELSILRDFASGMTEKQAFEAFQERRKGTTKASDKDRFDTYVKCAYRKAEKYGYDVS